MKKKILPQTKKCQKKVEVDMNLELYKIAIDGYQKHWEHYNHWMNMYAIFNGALFVGFYSVTGKDIGFAFEIVILMLGFVCGSFWYCSARGFYRWLLSWINIVQKHETELKKTLNNLDIDTKIYGTFVRIQSGCICAFSNRPFSTQKLTQFFTLSVAIIWFGMLLYNLSNKLFDSKVPDNIRCFIYGGAIVGLISFILLCVLSLCREGDLTKTHTVLIPGEKQYEFKSVNK